MSKVELRATKTFYNAGKFQIAGDTFSVDRFQANAFITRNLAEYANGEPANFSAGETVADLRAKAKTKNISGYSRMTKEDLITAIRMTEPMEGAEQNDEHQY